MDEKLKKRLEADGWTVGSAEEFLGIELPDPEDDKNPTASKKRNLAEEIQEGFEALSKLRQDGTVEQASSDTVYVCSVCKGRTKHNDRYDAYYCEVCNTWNEPACDDITCEFCANRPEKPL